MKTTSPLGPTLVTDRLIRRPTDAEDFERWAEFMADPVSARFLGGVQPRATAWRSFATMAGSWVVRGYGMFSLLERSTGRWVGRVGPWQPEGWPGTEVGWGLNRDATGKGYAAEAATATIDWAFEHLGWTEVVHAIAPDNLPSAKLAERLGARILRRARLPPPLEQYEVDVWGQTREAWAARRTSA